LTFALAGTKFAATVDIGEVVRVGEVLAVIARRFHSVASLDMSHFEWDPSDVQHLAEAVVTAFPDISSVRVHGWISVTDAFVDTLIRGLPRLVSVDFSECQSLTDATLTMFTENGALCTPQIN
jgi:hypothetical protein